MNNKEIDLKLNTNLFLFCLQSTNSYFYVFNGITTQQYNCISKPKELQKCGIESGICVYRTDLCQKYCTSRYYHFLLPVNFIEESMNVSTNYSVH